MPAEIADRTREESRYRPRRPARGARSKIVSRASPLPPPAPRRHCTALPLWRCDQLPWPAPHPPPPSPPPVPPRVCVDRSFYLTFLPQAAQIAPPRTEPPNCSLQLAPPRSRSVSALSDEQRRCHLSSPSLEAKEPPAKTAKDAHVGPRERRMHLPKPRPMREASRQTPKSRRLLRTRARAEAGRDLGCI